MTSIKNKDSISRRERKSRGKKEFLIIFPFCHASSKIFLFYMKIKIREILLFFSFLLFHFFSLYFAWQTKQKNSKFLLFFLFLSFFFLFNYFVLSMILTEPKEGQRKLLSVNSDATATSFSEAFHMAPANNPMDNMAASLRPKTGLQPMPPLTSTEKYRQNKKKLNLILIFFFFKWKSTNSLTVPISIETFHSPIE